ncbi:MAG: DUF1836 domain-containing protein [Acutalibacteraceae bacterium]
MNIDKAMLTEKTREWKRIMLEADLPLWSDLPKLELYMDQVVMLLNEYLAYIYELNNDEKKVTASMINNYVKMKIIPAPNKKKYSRIHLSRLIIICSLKKCLNISIIQRILPNTDDEKENERIYNSFVKARKKAVESEIKTIGEEFESVISRDNSEEICDMVTKMAVSTDIHKMFTEKFTETVFEKPTEKE